MLFNCFKCKKDRKEKAKDCEAKSERIILSSNCAVRNSKKSRFNKK